MAPDNALPTDLLAPLNALANPHRLDLVQLLRNPSAHFPPQPAGPVDEIGVCVSDLQEKLRLSQSTTSQYLALLERSGLVAAQRIGQWTYWKLNDRRVRAWIARLEGALTHPAGAASPAATSAVKLQAVLGARARIQPHVRCTPLEPSPALSRAAEAEIRIKFEHLQHTGSGAARAAVNWLRQMREEKPGPGAVAAGATGREIALAYAGQRLAIPVVVFLPEGANPQGAEQLRAFGAEVRLQADVRSAEEAALALARDHGWWFPPANSHPAVLSGFGTIALELFEEFAGLEATVIPVADPALFTAVASALKAVDPAVKAFGVQAEPDRGATGAPRPALPVDAGQGADRIVVVSGEQLRSAAAWMLAEHRMALPPAGVAAIAGLLTAPRELRGRRVAALIPAGNT